MIKAPFPWFGGKSRAADLVWRALGPANENRKLERIWFSRHCLSVDSQLSLLGAP